MNRTWEDFEVGKSFETGGITITDAHVVTFAGLTGDNHPIQMNEEYARKTIFGTRIAHGLLVFSIAAGSVLQSKILGDSIITLLKIRDITFLSPVKLGDTVHVVATVDCKSETSKPDRGTVTMEYLVKNQVGASILSSKLDFLVGRKK